MINKVRSTVVEGRVDARSLATIANSLTSRGILIKSKSHLVSTIIESYADMLIESNQGYEVESTEAALEILTALGINFQATIRRNLVKLSKQIGAERSLANLQRNLDPTATLGVDLKLLDKAQSIMGQDIEEIPHGDGYGSDDD